RLVLPHLISSDEDPLSTDLVALLSSPLFSSLLLIPSPLSSPLLSSPLLLSLIALFIAHVPSPLLSSPHCPLSLSLSLSPSLSLLLSFSISLSLSLFPEVNISTP